MVRTKTLFASVDGLGGRVLLIGHEVIVRLRIEVNEPV
jgi:hypothetical protein